MNSLPTDYFISDDTATYTRTNRHYGDVSIQDILHLPNTATIYIGEDFSIDAKIFKNLIKYLIAVHPEASI